MSTLVQRRELLTVHETVAFLAVSEKTVRRLIARGELPAVQLGARALRSIDESGLERRLLAKELVAKPTHVERT